VDKYGGERTLAIYDAAENFLADCLVYDRSLIFPGEHIWTTENLEEIHQKFIDKPDVSKERKFLEKFKIQIAGSTRELVILGAELLAVSLLFPTNIKKPRKLELVHSVLDWAGEKLPEDSILHRAFAQGIGSVGQRYFMKRPDELAFLIKWAERIKVERSDQRIRTLRDRDLLRGSLYEIEPDLVHQTRHMLTHLAIPDEFERISSNSQKKKLIDAFPDLVCDSSLDDDRKISQIRSNLEKLTGEPEFDFYDHSITREAWKGESDLNGLKPLQFITQSLASADPGLLASSFDVSKLSEATLLEEAELRQILELVEFKKQVIFEGPPGGGKTWVADKLARYLTGNPLEGPRNERYEIVQFHQSYGYEDFVQGIRPLSDDDGKLRYELRAGAFKRLCQLATENPDQTYVMLVDEINRGNISRILGELLFLLEYRKDSVRLAYSDENDSEFSIPNNVRILGTMNTTDRSLTQIDYALRRRFLFYKLMPVVNDRALVLEGWLSAKGIQSTKQQQLLRLFIELNRRITASLGEHFQVGHSYFMREGIEKREVQESLFKYEIHPLLEEYFFNSSDQATIPDRYSINSLLASENSG